ncbi:MAG TPA: efflux RND transporter permease subunit, partial [Longimicrobium sp.]|nr:efflux RND transporter permease subunit [Longimicrobium sp.]
DRAAGGLLRTRADVDAAVEHGAVERVRPKMMTVVAIIAGLLPILWSHGTGADVMKRIAAPMVGGMVSSTILTLVVIPAVYSLWKEREVRRAFQPSPRPPLPQPAPALTTVTNEAD